MEQGSFKGVLEGNQGLGAGTGHGIGGKGELDKNNTEGKERNWRLKFDKLDGAGSSEDNMGKATAGDGGFQGVGGFELICHLRLFEKCIIDKRILLSYPYPIANCCAHDRQLPI